MVRSVIDNINVLKIFILCLFPLFQQAVAETVTLTITTQVVEATPCILKNDLAVSFGEIRYDEIDGENYIRPINYQLSCNLSTGNKNAIKVMIKGSIDPYFDPGALSTDKKGLAIRIKQGKGRIEFPVNTWLNFTYPNFPVLQAVPIVDSRVVVKGGPFRASAMLVTDYQ